jgi:hypothetical protein
MSYHAGIEIIDSAERGWFFTAAQRQQFAFYGGIITFSIANVLPESISLKAAKDLKEFKSLVDNTDSKGIAESSEKWLGLADYFERAGKKDAANTVRAIVDGAKESKTSGVAEQKPEALGVTPIKIVEPRVQRTQADFESKKYEILLFLLRYQQDFGDEIVKNISRRDIESALDDLLIYSDRSGGIDRFGDCEKLLTSYSSFFHNEFSSFPAFVSYIVEANIPWEIIPKFPEIRAELSRINGKPYDFEKNPLVRLEGGNPVFAATMENGRDVIIKIADCREDVFATELLKIAEIQQSYGVSDYGGFFIVERVEGTTFESILNTKMIVSEKGRVPLTPEIVSSISYEIGKQMAAHYVFSIPDWHSKNFIVMFENGRASVSRIDFEKFSEKGPKETSFKLMYNEGWFDQAEFERGFLDGMAAIKSNEGPITSFYQQHFQEVISAQQKRGSKKITTLDAVLEDVQQKIKKSPEEALGEFQSRP